MGRNNHGPNAVTKFKNPEQFIDAKIEMLQDHFKITLDDDDIIRLKKYRTESEINAAVRAIIARHWSDIYD